MDEADEDWLPEPVQPWSRYAPDGLVATVLEQQSCVVAGFEQVERIGAWEKIIGWAQAQQLREMASFTPAPWRPPNRTRLSVTRPARAGNRWRRRWRSATGPSRPPPNWR